MRASGFARYLLYSGNQRCRNKSVLGVGDCDTCNGTCTRCSLASPSEDSSERGNQSLDFLYFAACMPTLNMGSSSSHWISSGTKTIYFGLLPMLSTNGYAPKDSNSAVVWLNWPFAPSRTAFFTPIQSKRWYANRRFPIELLVWCRCISRYVLVCDASVHAPVCGRRTPEDMYVDPCNATKSNFNHVAHSMT